ncbi:MAG TPA: hypothetical protein VL860_15150 [Planctomycetota bacterium]|nr:hypothetical protein [Planctomycetota bacterium]
MASLFVLMMQLGCAGACYAMAKASDNNPIVWALVGFFFPCLGLLLCYFMTRR